MALVDLAYSDEEIAQKKAEQARYSSMPQDYEGPKYPWGLELSLESGSLKKLGKTIADFKVGQEIQFTVVGRVTGVSLNEREGGEADSCVRLVATKMDFGDGAPVEDRLYPSMKS